MDAAMISFTEAGRRLSRMLLSQLTGDSIEYVDQQPIKLWSREQFSRRDALIYVAKLEDVAEAVAPLLCSSSRRPAVLVLDDAGTFCIPVLPGAKGEAYALARRIEAMIGSVPVIPRRAAEYTAFDLECWAAEQNIKIYNPQQIVPISGRIAAGVPVKLLSLVKIGGDMPEHLFYTSAPTEADIFFTVYDFSESAPDALVLVPPIVVLGIGCRKGASLRQIELAVFSVFARSHIHFSAVKKVCSIDMKKNEPGLLEFCEKYGLEYETFSSRELAAAKGNFKKIGIAARTVGIENVCERSAVLGAGENSKVIIPRTAESGITIAAAADVVQSEKYYFP